MKNYILTAALLRVKTTDDRGICNQVSNAVAAASPQKSVWPTGEYIQAMKALIQEFEKWPDYSGDSQFPVKAPWPQRLWITPKKAFFKYPLWKGRYGNARKKLLQFLISHFGEA